MESTIVIVGGPPASGKTTLASRLAQEFSLPLIAKDAIKGVLFEVLSAGDREVSERIGRTTFALMWHFVEVELAAGQSVIVEGNFLADQATPEFERLAGRFPTDVLQIHCRAPADVLYQRYEKRSAVRHPGHADGERLADVGQLLEPDRYLLGLLGEPITVDTTSFDDLDYDVVRRAVAAHLSR